MNEECISPTRIEAFTDFIAGVKVSSEATEGAPESCKADLPAEQKKECQSFTTWTQYTASAAGAVGTIATVVAKTVHDKKIETKIIDGLEALYDALSGVNEQFLQAIVDINAGKKYDPLPEPDPIPPFPDPEGKDWGQLLEEVWNTIKPWMEKEIGKIADERPGSPWIKILEGLVQSSQKIIDDLKKMLDKAPG